MTETMPDVQKQSIIELCSYLMNKYGISTIRKHKEVTSTDCPGNNYPFDEIVAAANGTTVSDVNSSAAIPATSNQEFTTGTYTITASDLIVRSEPAGAAVGYAGLTADGKVHDIDKDGALNKGTRITVKEIRTVGSNIWGRCPSGWVCLKEGVNVYAVKDETISSYQQAPKVTGIYEVTASDLIVRDGPNGNPVGYSGLTADGKNHDKDRDGALDQGTRVTVKEWTGNWAHIPSGWVSGDYLKKLNCIK